MTPIFKCPFCLYSFHKDSAIKVTENEDIPRYLCPNPQVKDLRGDKHCGRILPLNYFESRSTVISIAGGTNVGKTYYLIALLQLLKKNRSLQRLGFSCNLIGDKAAIDDLKKSWSTFDSKNPIQATKKEEGAQNKALLIHLMKKHGSEAKHVYLSFFDTPGEGYEDIEYMYKNFQCIYKADALLLLMEPMQVESLREQAYLTTGYEEVQYPHDLQQVFYNVIELLKNVQRNKKIIRPVREVRTTRRQAGPMPSMSNETESIADISSISPEILNLAEENTHQENVISDVGQTIEETIIVNKQFDPKPGFFRRLFFPKEREKVNCPIAIGLTKIDQVQNLILHEIPLDNEDFDTMYMKGERINFELIRDVSNEIQELVFDEENGEIGVKNLLEAQVKNYKFFGIKSGDVNEQNKIVSMDNPQGVLLPVLWLLNRVNFF